MPHKHWVVRQNKLEIPRDKDEVNKWESMNAMGEHTIQTSCLFWIEKTRPKLRLMTEGLVVSSVLPVVDDNLPSSSTWTDETDGTVETIIHLILVRFTSNFVHPPPLPRFSKSVSRFEMTSIFSFEIFNVSGTDEIPGTVGEMTHDSKGLEEDDIESSTETQKDRHRMRETREGRPGHTCPLVICGTDPIFYHAPSISRHTEMSEFQSYYIGSGTNVTQPNKCKCNKSWRPYSEKSAGRCREPWVRRVQSVSGVLINTPACDTRWKLYAVVIGRKNTVRICPVATNGRKSVRHNTRPGPKRYDKERSLTWNSTLKTSRGFSVWGSVEWETKN
jgi:hypothetical protein